MVNSDVGQAILEAVSRLSEKFDARLDKVESRLDKVESRLDKLESRLDKVEARLGAIEAKLDAHDKRFDVIDTRFDAVESRLSEIEKQSARFQRRLEALETAVAELTHEIRTWPDMHLLSASARMQIDRSRELRNEVRDVKIRIDEIFKNMATDSEIHALRDEVASVRDQSLDFDLRLRTIEARLGMVVQSAPTA